MIKDKKRLIIFFLIIFAASFLRLWKLGSNPPALYWDEASLGYNAYSILTTGKDEHGEILPLSRFIAFGDYKPSGYIYAAVPSLFIFGVNEFAIRFPSAVAGIGLVAVTYFLAKQLFKNHGSRDYIALLAAMLIAISPWHILFSRVAFEANLATFFAALGLLFFLHGINRGKYLVFSALFFSASFYTFNTHRVFLPLILAVLAVIFKKELFKQKKWAAAAFLVGILFIVPLIPFLLSREGNLRYQEVTIFNNLEPVERANYRIEREGNTLFARVVHNRRVQFGLDFAKHYFDHFRADFLFFIGDVNPRLGTRDQGLLYPLELVFLISGIYFLVAKGEKTALLILLLWWLVGIIPAATARETPHALRTMNILPAPYLISAFGLYYLYKSVRLKKIFIWLVIGLYLFFLADFLHTYFIHYPVKWASSWQYGYKEAVGEVVKLQGSYDKIFVTNKYGRPYIYFLLYQRYSPHDYWLTRKAERDWFGFWTVKGFVKYFFGDIPKEKTTDGEKWLVVTDPEGFPSAAKPLSEIHYPDGKAVFVLGEL